MSRSVTIRNMVCPRCITAVESVLESQNIPYESVQLGTILFSTERDTIDLAQLSAALNLIGFQIIDDPKLNTVNKVKTILIECISNPLPAKHKLSHLLSDALKLNYQSISHTFLNHEGTTIEKYFIRLKIEKVKELLSYNELTLKEIAYQLNYSSVAHLSKQFKEVLGMSPTEYKANISPERLFLSDI